MIASVGVDLGTSAYRIALDADVIAGESPAPDLTTRVGKNVPHLVDADGRRSVRSPHVTYVDVIDTLLETVVAPVPDDSKVVATLAVPAWWTRRNRALVREALDARGMSTVELVSDAQAALLGARARGLDVGARTLVIDLGASTVSATVVSQDGESTAVAAKGVLFSGGRDLDRAVLHHFVAALRESDKQVDPGDPEHVAAAHELLAGCRSVRESLSHRSAVTADGVEPWPGRLRIVREEFEVASAQWTTDVVRLAGTVAGQDDAPIDGVLLVGGLAPTPMVAQAVSSALGVAVLLDDEPHSSTAAGAAFLAQQRGERHRPARWWRRAEPEPWVSLRRSALAEHRPLELEAGLATDEPPMSEKPSSVADETVEVDAEASQVLSTEADTGEPGTGETEAGDTEMSTSDAEPEVSDAPRPRPRRRRSRPRPSDDGKVTANATRDIDADEPPLDAPSVADEDENETTPSRRGSRKGTRSRKGRRVRSVGPAAVPKDDDPAVAETRDAEDESRSPSDEQDADAEPAAWPEFFVEAFARSDGSKR